MSRPEDESRTELAWREIVQNYGERPVLDDETGPTGEPAASSDDAPSGDDPAGPAEPADPAAGLPPHLVDDDPVERREQAVTEAERFRPPPPPPLPVPRTWQRGVAWAGVFVAPVIALLIGLLSVYVHPVVGWALIGWFVGGFAYLVRQMPRTKGDPWDDGSRV